MSKISFQIRRLLYSPASIVVALAFSFYLGLGSVPLFDLDEGAFTEATREMLDSGVFSATYLDGEPRYDKPIFFYWLQAASISLVGYNEWAFRLPSVLMASLWAFALYFFAREFLGSRRGLIATLFLVNSLWVALIARSAIADATLNLFLSLALFDIWRFFEGRQQKHILRVYLWMALATLTKGPVGVVVPLLTSLIFLLVSRADKKLYGAYFNPLGWAVYIITVAPWLIAVYLEQGMGFFEGFIIEHNLKRFSATREDHGGTLLYYFVTLPFIVLPFTGILGAVFKPWKRQWQDPLSRFLLIWFAVYFVIFSFSKTQLPHYILNGCVPLFILFARAYQIHNRRRWFTLFPLGFMAILVFLPQLVALGASESKSYDAAMLARHGEIFTWHYSVLATIAFALMLFVALLPKLRTWQRLVLCGLILNTFTFTVFVRIASAFQQQPIHSAIAFLQSRQERIGHEETIVAYRMHMPSFSVYREKITPLRAPEVNELVLTRVDRIGSLKHHVSESLHDAYAQPLWQEGGLVIFTILPTAQRDIE